jgi:hypothetical protein
MSDSFQTKLAKYKTLIDANNPARLTEIQTLNRELAAEIHTLLEKSGNDLQQNHDALIGKLVSLQNDSSIMELQSDQYQTLQMLQNHEYANFSGAFFWYSISLGIAAILFVLILMWKGGYKAPIIPTMTSSPTTMPALT